MRRGVLQAVLVALLAAIPLGLGRAAPQRLPKQAKAPPPNVLIIVTDDQRSGMDVMPKTKRIFTRYGRRMSDARIVHPLCCPSRASIMTGRYPHNHGVTDNFSSHELEQSTTLQRYLQDAGYSTGLFGKYFNAWPVATPPPYFDRWSMLGPEAHYHDAYWNLDGQVTFVERYSTHFTGSEAVDYLEELEYDDDRPWFMYMATTAPHAPYTPSPKYEGARVGAWPGNPAVFEEDRSDKPPQVQGQTRGHFYGATTRAKQYRTLMSVDDMVGRIFSRLTRLGESRSTLAFFISDNGYLWGEHGLGGKRQPYKPSSRVPMMMRWPEMVEGGSVDRRITANIDIAPTILHAAGLRPDEPMDGRSLLRQRWDRDRILLEYGPDPRDEGHWASTLTKDYQYIERYHSPSYPTPSFEYYDLVNDPWQLENLLGDADLTNDPDPVHLAEVKAQLEDDKDCTGRECP